MKETPLETGQDLIMCIKTACDSFIDPHLGNYIRVTSVSDAYHTLFVRSDVHRAQMFYALKTAHAQKLLGAETSLAL